ncbi:MAG TPA: hypothetical protein VFM57_02445 [Thermoleophilaceae bacterium]|nr:hypothetical protein [Thermoleophilaceae bacterium]
MALDRLLRHEQLLGDLPVRPPGGGQAGHTSLAGRQRLDPAQRGPPRPRTRGQQLVPRALRKRVRAAREGEVNRSAERLNVENNYGYQDPFGPNSGRSPRPGSRAWP